MKDFFQQLKAIAKRKSSICAFCVLAIYTVICSFENPAYVILGISSMAVYVILAFLVIHRGKHPGKKDADASDFPGVSLNFLAGFRSPVVILDQECKIMWYNSAFVSATDARHTLFGKTAVEIISPQFTAERAEQLKSGATFSVNLNERDFAISGYGLSSGKKAFTLIVLDDKTELEDTKRLLSDRNAVVAFIMLDNISESLPFAQDKYRRVSAQVAGVISEWGKSIGALVKEYDRDKFILVFEEKKLEPILSSKFEILDSIRETEIEDIEIPITASIGISNIEGTLSEKETAARSALELALQRGGDQAVFRSASSTEYYGGKTKTVQKKTKIRSRIVAGELCELIKQSGNVIIMGHKFCDHDSIASCVAISRIATFYEKEAKIVVNVHDANLKPIFQKMRGHTYYHELFTDAAAAQDMLRSDTLLVICDTNNPDLFESREIFENCINFCIIDHHRKVQEEYVIAPKLAYIEPSASSAAELVSEIAEYAVPEGTLTKLEAELLFAGIILDTNNFKKNTGVKTFSAALFLRSQGADPNEAQGFFRTNLDDFLYETNIENNISAYRDSILIATSDLESHDPSQTKLVSSKCADRLLGINGVEAAFVLAEIGSDTNISARSSGSINVQLILELLGGGGHFDAAGALLKDTDIGSAEELLKSAIDSILDHKKQQTQY